MHAFNTFHCKQTMIHMMHKHECSPPPAPQCLVSAIANTWHSQHSLQTKWHAVLPAVCSVFVCSLLALHSSAKCLPTYFPHLLHVVLPALTCTEVRLSFLFARVHTGGWLFVPPNSWWDEAFATTPTQLDRRSTRRSGRNWDICKSDQKVHYNKSWIWRFQQSGAVKLLC